MKKTRFNFPVKSEILSLFLGPIILTKNSQIW